MNEQYDLVIEQITKPRAITEDLKAKNQMKWMQEMNTVKHDAIDVILYNNHITQQVVL